MQFKHLHGLRADPFNGLPASPGPGPEPASGKTPILSQATTPRETSSTSISIRQRPVAVDVDRSGSAAAKADRFAAEWKQFMRLAWPPAAQRAFIRQWLTANAAGVDLLLQGELLKKMVDTGCRGIGIAVAECMSHRAVFVRNADQFFTAMKGRTELGLTQEQRLELATALLAQGRGCPPIRELLQAQRKTDGLLAGYGGEGLSQSFDQAMKVSDDPALVSRLTLALHKKDGEEICTILSEVWDAGSNRSPLQRFNDARRLVDLCIAHGVPPRSLVEWHGRELRQLPAGSGFLVAQFAVSLQNRSESFDSMAWRRDVSLWASLNGEPIAAIESAAALLADGRLIESVARGRKGVSPLIAHLTNAAASKGSYWSAMSDPANRQRVLGLLRELLLAGGVPPKVCEAYLKACDEAFERAYASNSPPVHAMAAPAKSTRGGLKKTASEAGTQKKSARFSGDVDVAYRESEAPAKAALERATERLNLAENTRQPDNPKRRIRLPDQLGWSDMDALKTATPIVGRRVQFVRHA